MNAKLVAQICGCTEEQARRQYARNSKQLRQMANKAKKTGKKVNGFDAAYLLERANCFAEKATQ